MNMLRVPGTMQYESDAFHEACDGLGVLVFQDFMFANMDYPADDPAFAAEVRAEAQDFLARTCGRPCLGVLCGGSEGMNGPELHVAHDGTAPLEARLVVTLYRAGRTPIAQAQTELTVAARSVHRSRVDALFPRFVDAGCVYRFGPPSHHLLVARLQNAEGAEVARAFVCPPRAERTRDDPGLSATCEARAGHAGVLLHTQGFARRVALELENGEPADNYFHPEPGGQRWIEVRTAAGAALDVATLRGRVKALNASSWVQLARVAAVTPPAEGSS
jgi:hypothetical protein